MSMLMQTTEESGLKPGEPEFAGASRGVALSLLLSPFTQDSRVLRQLGTLLRVGFETHILALHSQGLAEREANNDYYLHRLRCSIPFGQVRGLPKVAGLIECAARMFVAGVRRRPKLIHANDLNALPIAYAISLATGAKVVYDAHELWSDPVCYQAFPAFTYRAGVWLEGFLARRCAGVITVSDGIARQMSATLDIGLPTVVRNVPAPAAANTLNRDLLRGALGIEREEQIILHTGSVEPGRGIETLVEALPMLTCKPVVVLLGTVDDEAYYATITARAIKLGLSNRIFLHPPVAPADVLAYASGADVGVSLLADSCLNNQLALPNKLFEYLQAGLPVVLSASVERNALLDRYGIGESFEAGNPETLAAAIDRVLDRSKVPNRYLKNVQAAARELNWEQEELRLMGVYRSALAV